MEPKYRLMELTTIGWEDWNEKTPDMNKEQCQELYQGLIGDGINPDDLKIVRVA